MKKKQEWERVGQRETGPRQEMAAQTYWVLVPKRSGHTSVLEISIPDSDEHKWLLAARLLSAPSVAAVIQSSFSPSLTIP